MEEDEGVDDYVEGNSLKEPGAEERLELRCLKLSSIAFEDSLLISP